jgi:hypothetical protein
MNGSFFSGIFSVERLRARMLEALSKNVNLFQSFKPFNRFAQFKRLEERFQTFQLFQWFQ